MKMLRYRSLVVVLFLFVAIPGRAQDMDPGVLSNPGLVSARAMIRASQEATIREELRLTDEEESVFWPIYQNYRADMLPIQDRYVALVAGYLQNYESGVLTDKYAEDVLDSYFEIKSDLLQMRKRYIRKFRKDLPMLKVARFYQLENKMNADIDAELALIVPLIEAN